MEDHQVGATPDLPEQVLWNTLYYRHDRHGSRRRDLDATQPGIIRRGPGGLPGSRSRRTPST
jgi:hypothetical protein